MIPRVVLYAKACCPLCDEAREALERVRSDVAFDLEEVDIEEDPELQERYGSLIPVVTLDGTEIFYGKVSVHRMRALLARARRADRPGGGPLLNPRYAAFLRRLRARLEGAMDRPPTP